MAERKWRVRLSAAAELDFANILKWTTENFGAQQSRLYRDTLVQAIRELADGPSVAGSKTRDEILPGLRTLHVARRGRRGRHFLLYRPVHERIIEMGRICTTAWTYSATRHFPSTRAENSESGAAAGRGAGWSREAWRKAVAAACSGVEWRATVDEDGHYSFAVAL